jgi:hypothetical protein
VLVAYLASTAEWKERNKEVDMARAWHVIDHLATFDGIPDATETRSGLLRRLFPGEVHTNTFRRWVSWLYRNEPERCLLVSHCADALTVVIQVAYRKLQLEVLKQRKQLPQQRQGSKRSRADDGSGSAEEEEADEGEEADE